MTSARKAAARKATRPSADEGHEEGSTTRTSFPISVRLGDLDGAVSARAGDRESSASILKRDLARYYELLTEAVRRVWFTLPEAEAIVLALGPKVDTPPRYLWAEIERQYLENDDDPDFPTYYNLPDDVDAAVLVEKLRKLDLLQTHAVIDAVETYWTNHDGNPDDVDTQALVELHLTSAHSVKETVQRRAQERARIPGGPDNMVLRDPAAGLRRRVAEQEDE